MRYSLLEKVINLLSPRYCPMCESRLLGTEEMLCIPCLRHLPITPTWEDPYENRMARMFWGRIPIERCVSLYYYEGHSDPSYPIYKLKYHHRPDIGEYLGRLIAEKGIEANLFEGIDALLPVPITKARRKERGYNQSECIAKGIQEKTGLPIITDAIARNIFTASQTKKNRWERLENVDHAFCLSDSYTSLAGKVPITDLDGKHLLLIDDVCTTGATLVSLGQELQKAGKVRLSIATIGWAKE